MLVLYSMSNLRTLKLTAFSLLAPWHPRLGRHIRKYSEMKGLGPLKDFRSWCSEILLPCPKLQHIVIFDLLTLAYFGSEPFHLLTGLPTITSLKIHGDDWMTVRHEDWEGNHVGSTCIKDNDSDALCHLQHARDLTFSRTGLKPQALCDLLQGARALQSLRWIDPDWEDPPAHVVTKVSSLWNIGVALGYVRNQLTTLDIDMKLNDVLGRMAYGPIGFLTVIAELRELRSLSISLQGLWGRFDTFQCQFLDQPDYVWTMWDDKALAMFPPMLQHLTIYEWLPDTPDCTKLCLECGTDCSRGKYYKAIRAMFWSLRRRNYVHRPDEPILRFLRRVTWVPHPDVQDQRSGPITENPARGAKAWQSFFAKARIEFLIKRVEL